MHIHILKKGTYSSLFFLHFQVKWHVNDFKSNKFKSQYSHEPSVGFPDLHSSSEVDSNNIRFRGSLSTMVTSEAPEV